MTRTTNLSRPTDASRLRAVVATTSLLITALGLGWWLGDVLWYYSPDERGSDSLIALLPRQVDAAIATSLGLVGAVVAVRGHGRPLAAVAVVQTLVFAVVAGDIGVLIVLGYLTALAFPLVLTGALLWGAARSRVARGGLATLVLVAGTAVVASGVFTPDSMRDLGDGLVAGMRTNLVPHLVIALLVGHGLLWALLGVRAARSVRGACAACGRPGAGSLVLRWQVPVTLLAAACGLPYFLFRLTWLTGNPLGLSGAEFETRPGVQVMGILLGLCGLVAATLTIGLLRPWGRVIPRWIPVVGGRDVPVMFPTMTAGVVGAVMTIAGRSLVQSIIADRMSGGEAPLLYLFLLPLPVWGPALMLAAWAYYLRHRGVCRSCGQGDRPHDGTYDAAPSPGDASRTA